MPEDEEKKVSLSAAGRAGRRKYLQADSGAFSVGLVTLEVMKGPSNRSVLSTITNILLREFLSLIGRVSKKKKICVICP